jgi:hypothetical protein
MQYNLACCESTAAAHLPLSCFLVLLRCCCCSKGHVEGYIALAPMFGGSIATLAARASGLYDYVLPWLTEELTAVLGGAENVKQHMYSVTQGMPSVVQMMPYAEAFGPQAVRFVGLRIVLACGLCSVS